MREGWQQTTLGALARRLVNGGTPPTEIEAFWNGTIPWITGADFTARGVEEFRRFVSAAAIRQTSTNVIHQGQLLIVTRTGVGKLALAPCDIAISQDITGLYVDETKADPRFLFHRMRTGVQDLKKLNQGTSINGIIRSDLVAYRLELPPLPVQQRITDILSTLDCAIEQTEAFLAKQRLVRTGLILDLFQRGVLTNGKMRDPAHETPQSYRQSKYGQIPDLWIDGCLGNFLANKPKNGYSPPEVSRGSDCKALGLSCLTRDGFKPLHVKSVAGDRVAIEAATLLEGDLLISRSNTPDLVGMCGIYKSIGERCIYPDLMMKLYPTRVVLNEFMEAVLQSPSVRRQIKVVAVGTSGSMVKLNGKTVSDLHIVVPPIDEQERIVDRIKAEDRLISQTGAELEKLLSLQKGVSGDLLRARPPEDIGCI